MKEHADKAVSHKTKVLGKTVPTLLLIGLFLAGTGTAAVLTSFGTVDGQADVDQSIVINGDGEFEFEGSTVVAGNSDFTTTTVENNADVRVDSWINTVQEQKNGNDWETADAGAIETSYFLGQTYTDESNTDQEELETSSEVIEFEDQPAVNLSVVGFDVEDINETDAEASAGFTFATEIEEWTEEPVTVETVEGPAHESDKPDWIFYTVELEDQVTVETEGLLGDAEEVLTSEFNVLNFNAENEKTSFSDLNEQVFVEGDRYATGVNFEEAGDQDINLSSGTVTSVTVATGTADPDRDDLSGSGTESELYVTNVEAGDESPFFEGSETEQVTLRSTDENDYELGVLNSFDVALDPAYDFKVTTDFETHDEH